MNLKESIASLAGHALLRSPRILNLVESRIGYRFIAGETPEDALRKYEERAGDDTDLITILQFMTAQPGDHYLTDEGGHIIKQLYNPNPSQVLRSFEQQGVIEYRALFMAGGSWSITMEMMDESMEESALDQNR